MGSGENTGENTGFNTGSSARLIPAPPPPSGDQVDINFEGGALGSTLTSDESGVNFVYDDSKNIFSNSRTAPGSTQSAESILDGGTGGGNWGWWQNIDSGGRWPSQGIGGVGQGEEFWMRCYVNMDGFNYSGLLPKGWRINATGGGSLDMYPKADELLFENWIDLGQFYNNNNPADGGSPEYGDFRSPGGCSGWEHWEWYIRAHSTSGQGIIRWWRNGLLIFEDTRTRTLRNSGSKYHEQGFWLAYAGGSSPQTQSTFVDSVIYTKNTPAATDDQGNPYIGP